MIDSRNFFDQCVKNDTRTYENIRKFATGWGDDYATVCLLDYTYFKENYITVVMDLNKQKALDACPKHYNKVILLEYWKKCNNVFHYRRSKRNYFEFFKYCVNVFHKFSQMLS